MILRALTLWRPWTYAITHANKRIENRPWGPPRGIVGQYLALHAGKKYDDYGRLSIRDITGWDPPDEFGCPQGIVAVCKVLGSYSTYAETDAQLEHLRDVVASVYTDQRPWVFGPYCWVLGEVTPIEPVQCKGAQGLWSVPENLLWLVRQRWKTARKAT